MSSLMVANSVNESILNCVFGNSNCTVSFSSS
ncbi:hypothetical protein HB818_16275 [Listeria booriae]|nr:hypothetical protein [Listeria booriae]